MNIFIKKSDRTEIEIYAWEENGEVKATGTDTEVPSGTDAKILKFFLRKPNYSDSMNIIKNCQVRTASGVSIDGASFQEWTLRTLLVDWDLSAIGDTTSFSSKALSELHPALAIAIGTKAIETLNL